MVKNHATGVLFLLSAAVLASALFVRNDTPLWLLLGVYLLWDVSFVASPSSWTGEWVRESPRGTYMERWHVQSDSTFEGFSEVRSPAGELRAYEALRIVAIGGEVFYIAKVGENALPVPFKMVSCEPGEVRFENAAHDFPKSLTYTQNEAGSLHVAVRGEGEDGFDLHFKRRP